MQPIIDGYVIVGKMWSFRSKASDDLGYICGILSDIPRCDTKKEIVTLIRRAINGLDDMKRRIGDVGTDYLLNDCDGDNQ